MKIKKVMFCIGEEELSEERKLWIKDFLEFFKSVFLEKNNLEIEYCEFNRHTDIESNTLVIGHEFRDYTRMLMIKKNIKWIDIRISPVRFLEHDFIFAIASNCEEINKKLKLLSLSKSRIEIEAHSISSSLRWRDLGQSKIENNSLVFFLEQQADIDSINFSKSNSPVHFEKELELHMKNSENYYYVERGTIDIDHIKYLERKGFRKLNANIYSILSSNNVNLVLGIRGGILSESRYFKKQTFNLDSITTPLSDISDETITFHNIAPSKILNIQAIDFIIDSQNTTQPVNSELPFSSNLLRRSMNIWNSTLETLYYNTQEWNILFGNYRLELDYKIFKLNSKDKVHTEKIDQISGNWQWFSGEKILITDDGFFRSENDYGYISEEKNVFIFNWENKKLKDFLVANSDLSNLSGKNTYGDIVSAERIDNI